MLTAREFCCFLPISFGALPCFLPTDSLIFSFNREQFIIFIETENCSICKVLTMPPQKKDSKSTAKGTTQPSEASTQRHPQKAGISSPVRFSLAVLSSLALNSGLFALTSSIHLDELQHVSKPLNSCDLGGLLAWRAFEVGLAWVLGYDGNAYSLLSCKNITGKDMS